MKGKSVFIGHDNGVNGGIVAIDDNQNILFQTVIPIVGKSKKEYDVSKMVELFTGLLHEETKIYAAVEKAQPMFRDGTKQSFKTGFGFGLIQGILTSLGISYEIVAPKVWQKDIFQGNVENSKEASIMFCKKKYPGIDLRATKRSVKDHDGISDALCMAVYCYRRNR